MLPGRLILVGLFCSTFAPAVIAQQEDSLFVLSGMVYDQQFNPLPASHVINLNTRRGTITDTLGIFRLPVCPEDTLLIRNIAFLDTVVPVQILQARPFVRMRKRYYALQEAKVFPWGSSYNDFRAAMVTMPEVRSLGESLGLPRQDPGYVPREMDETYVKSPGFLITSPVSFFYQNFSRHAKSARKVHWFGKNREKRERFNEIFTGENIASISGYTGERLESFLLFLNARMRCDYDCSELEIYSEIHRLLEEFRAVGEQKSGGQNPE